MRATHSFSLAALMIACWVLWDAPSPAQDGKCQQTTTFEHVIGEGYRLIVAGCQEEDSSHATLKIMSSQGRQVQTLFADVTSPSAVALTHITGGAVADIYVPEASGNANTAYSVWAFDPAQKQYVRILDSSGTNLTREDSGIIVNEARGSCCSWVYDFYRWVPSDFRLAQVAQLEIVAQDIDEATGEAGSVTCRAMVDSDDPTGTDGPAIALVGRYCSEYVANPQLELSRGKF